LLGAPDVRTYLKKGAPSASVIGRVANRISKSKFSLDGKNYTLDTNENENTLHSGSGNYALKNFTLLYANESSAQFVLKDFGEGGFPGEVNMSVTYTIKENNILEIHYQAISSCDTPINLTNHAYFNLNGHASGPVYKQKLQIMADFYTITNKQDIPSGEICKVEKTPFDLRKSHTLGLALADLATFGDWHNGFDHNFVFHEKGIKKAAIFYDPESGRKMEVFTDLPGMQLYCGNFIPKGFKGKDGASYGPHSGICLETQYFPDSVNIAHFPNCITKANTVFSTKTSFHFGIK
jgi:aldose 1-epimerase